MADMRPDMMLDPPAAAAPAPAAPAPAAPAPAAPAPAPAAPRPLSAPAPTLAGRAPPKAAPPPPPRALRAPTPAPSTPPAAAGPPSPAAMFPVAGPAPAAAFPAPEAASGTPLPMRGEVGLTLAVGVGGRPAEPAGPAPPGRAPPPRKPPLGLAGAWPVKGCPPEPPLLRPERVFLTCWRTALSWSSKRTFGSRPGTLLRWARASGLWSAAGFWS